MAKVKVLPFGFSDKLQSACDRQHAEHAGNESIRTLLNDCTSFYLIAEDKNRSVLAHNQAVGFAISKLESAIRKMDKGQADKTLAITTRMSLLAEVNPTLFARKVAHANENLKLYNKVMGINEEPKGLVELPVESELSVDSE